MILGITGGIATGKSSVARMFGDCGAVVVSADDLSRQAVAPGSATLAALTDRFGRQILDASGALDRTALAALVFSDSAARADLNRITHPAIARLADEKLHALSSAGHPLIVYEAPLLFEASAESRVDQVLVVTVDPDIQLDRLIKRDGLSRGEALARIEAQMPLFEKISRADYVIDNSGSIDETKDLVKKMYQHLISSSSH